jgi:hypothetical protein
MISGGDFSLAGKENLEGLLSIPSNMNIIIAIHVLFVGSRALHVLTPPGSFSLFQPACCHGRWGKWERGWGSISLVL